MSITCDCLTTVVAYYVDDWHTKLTQQFDNDLLVLSGSGVANLLVFRSKASSMLWLVDDEEDNISENFHISENCG